MLKYMYQLLQYHSNVSYHRLARNESHIARNKTRLARNKNCLTRNYMYMYRPRHQSKKQYNKQLINLKNVWSLWENL